MEKQSTVLLRQDYSDRLTARYICSYFDHLHSEYLRLAPTVDAKKISQLGERLGPVFGRRKSEELTWDDVYSFDLELLELLPEEDLVRKAYDMRAKYRSIAGARDYDAYIASKPPDLTTLQMESAKKPEDKVSVATEVLRADVRYLLGQFYLHYSLMPLREGLRDELTRRARKWTLIFLGVFTVVITSSQLLGKFGPEQFRTLMNSTVAIVTSTVGVVIFSGIMGGCVSMLQRIQSAPSEGDALYNLTALSHGWKGISLSPLYGAIFAILLFILFTAGILKGAVFPEVVELGADQRTQDKMSTPGLPPTATPTPGQSAVAAPPPALTAATALAPSTAVAPSPTATASPSPTASPAPKPSPAVSSLPFSNTAPANGQAYALLVIWSFIAGFAERLVPDTLNRLVTKNQSIQGTNA